MVWPCREQAQFGKVGQQGVAKVVALCLVQHCSRGVGQMALVVWRQGVRQDVEQVVCLYLAKWVGVRVDRPQEGVMALQGQPQEHM